MHLLPDNLKLPDLHLAGMMPERRHKPLTTGVARLDEVLGGGIPGGAVTEILGETAGGCWWFGLSVLARVSDRTMALVEPAGTFFPPGAASLGVDLGRLLVVRESNRKRALWALDRIARDASIGVTLAAVHGLSDTEVRRLQLSAESSGQAVILLRAPAELSRSSWGALRLMLRAQPSGGAARRIVVETLRMRGAVTPRPVLLELDDDSLAVSTSTVLPHRADHAGVSHRAG